MDPPGWGGRCVPRPAGKARGRPGEDLGGGQGVSRAGGEELGPGAGPGPPPLSRCQLPFGSSLLFAAPSRLLREHMVPPEPDRRVPSEPCLALPSLVSLPCPKMSLTGAVASLLRRPREHRGDVGCEARQGRRRCQQHEQRRRWGGPGEWGEDRPPPGPAGSGEVVAKSRAGPSCLLGPGERFSAGRKRRVSAAKQRPWLPLLPGSPRKLAVPLLPVTPRPLLAPVQLREPRNDPPSWGFVVPLGDFLALGWRSPLLSWLSQAGCLPKGFSL